MSERAATVNSGSPGRHSDHAAMPQRAGFILVASVMCVLVSAALLKAADISEFRDALANGWNVPTGWSDVLAVAVPALEMSLAVAWFLGLARGAVIVGAAAFLIAVTGAFIWQWILRAPPDCMCFGKIKMFEDAQHAAMWVVVRNAGLLCLLLMGAWLSRARSARPEPAEMHGGSHAPRLHAH